MPELPKNKQHKKVGQIKKICWERISKSVVKCWPRGFGLWRVAVFSPAPFILKPRKESSILLPVQNRAQSLSPRNAESGKSVYRIPATIIKLASFFLFVRYSVKVSK